MKKIFFLLALLIPVQSLSAQESGVFLKLPMSVRAAGMGDAFTAVSNEPFGAYYNPAGIAFVPRPAVSFAHHIYLQDINGDSAGFVLPIKNLSIGAAPAIFKMKDEAVYDSFGNDTGQKFGYQAMIAPVTVAGLFGGLAVGFTAKYYSEKIGGESSGTSAFDAGAIYRFNRLQFGFATQNLGGKVFDYDVVKIQRFGAAYAGKDFGISADAVKEGVAGNSLNVGGEFSLFDSIRLRGGWRLRKDFGGPTLGLGFNWANLILDYAFISYGGLGDTHKMGVSYRFGAIGEKPVGKPVAQPVPGKSAEIVNIAVADFTGKNVSQADASIVTDFLRTQLVAGGTVNVMDRNNMDTVLAEQKFQSSGCTEQECAVQMGKLLNVKYMVVGSLSKLMDSYYITVNLIDVESSKIVVSYDQEASSSRGLKQACDSLARKLSVFR